MASRAAYLPAELLALEDPVAMSRTLELDLVVAARRGERSAMQRLYEAEAPRLVQRLRHLTGDVERAQDFAHDAFVIAFSGRSPFDGTSSASTWLYGIARNLWRNDRRKTSRRSALRPGRLPTISEPSDTTESAVAQELLTRLDAALAALDPALREAFALRVIEQLSLRDAAELASVSQPTMSKRATKAELLVRRALESSQD